MFSDSVHQPLYLRSSHPAPAPEAEEDAFWLALQDQMASHINENANAANGHGQDNECAFADLMSYDRDGGYNAGREAARRQGGGSWPQGFAGLDDALALAFAERGDDGDRSTVPDLVSVPSSDSESDDESFSSSSSKKGVSFSSTVEVRTIPSAKSYSPSQRRRMYASPSETRRNKIRNKKEFRYDGRDWRNATEEQDMGVDELTGELVHPAHELNWDC